mmetsp:Transcript_32782/g.102167  ORF Transcript_32782/g.102167 Transcript_32782/m.102167 type:complete len:89 (+) Transcript_32782:554-820(+)
MWFCYLPEERRAGCAAKIRAVYVEGIVPTTGATILLFGLSYIMRDQWQFTWALSWVDHMLCCWLSHLIRSHLHGFSGSWSRGGGNRRD